MKKNRVLLIVLVLFFISVESFSQIGIDFIGNSNNYKTWNELLYEKAVKDSEIFKYSYGVGVNYWFSLHDLRVEFTPGLYFLHSEFVLDEKEAGVKYVSNQGGLEFDINVYLFDFYRKSYKRDCPSFSNGNDWLKSGFFVQASPKIFGDQRELLNSEKNIRYLNIGGKFDFGVGIDIGISKHLVISPILKYGFDFGDKWEGLSEYHGEDNFSDRSSNSYISFVLAFYRK